MKEVEQQVQRYRLEGIAEEMGDVLQRTAFSPNIKERRDFSCAICDAEGRLVAQAAHIPVHLGAVPATMAAFLDCVDPDPETGYLLNDPYAGGTHLPDLSYVEPVPLLGNDVGAYVINRAHHTDVGGEEAGSMTPTRHIDEEGFRTGPRAVTYDGELRRDAIEDLLAVSRTPEQRVTDLEAQVAAARRGRTRLDDWYDELGPPYREVFEEIMDYARRFCLDFVETLPDGTARARDVLDDDGFDHEGIPLVVRLSVDGDRMAVDFTGSADQVEGNLNCPRAVTTSAIYYVLRCFLGEEVPVNHGVFDPVTVRTRSGSLLEVEPPGAVAAGNVETSQRIVDVLFRVFENLKPGMAPAASQGTMNNVTFGATVEGEHRSYYETLGGGAGGGPGHAGVSGRQVHMTNTQNTPVEEFERRFPLRIEELKLREGSGGEGRHPGGDGLVKSWEALEPVTVSLLTERRLRTPYGLRGGDGSKGENSVRKSHGRDRKLPGKTTLTLESGEVLTLKTPGGGGWSPE